MTRAARVGDLVDAEYEDGHASKPLMLRGVVVSVGEWDGKQTASVYGIDAYGEKSSTSSSTMPTHLVAAVGTEEARTALADLLAAGRINARLVSRMLETLTAPPKFDLTRAHVVLEGAVDGKILPHHVWATLRELVDALEIAGLAE